MADPLLTALERDEAYAVVAVLAHKPTCTTELVVPVGGGSRCVRKRIALPVANQEAWERLAAIRDPHLPRVIETYQLPDQLAVVCEFVEGTSLEQLVQAQGALDPQAVRGIIEDVCKAAGVLHAYGIVHRDITPANVIVGAGDVRLIDLGIARVGEAGAQHDTTTLGTWGFAAPEQYGFAQTDARSDVYSIGCLAAYMLTGVRPDEEGFDEAVAALPDRLRGCIDKARSFEPSARYQSAAELGMAFRDACGRVAHAASTLTARTHVDVFQPAYSLPADIPSQGNPSPAKLPALPSDRSEMRPISIPDISAAWAGASLARRLGAALTAVMLVSAGGGMFSASSQYLDKGDAASAFEAALVSLYFVWLFVDIVMLILKAGPYGRAQSRGRLLLKRASISFLICILVVSILVVTLNPLLNAGSP